MKEKKKEKKRSDRGRRPLHSSSLVTTSAAVTPEVASPQPQPQPRCPLLVTAADTPSLTQGTRHFPSVSPVSGETAPVFREVTDGSRMKKGKANHSENSQ